jgi:hypothetical protein
MYTVAKFQPTRSMTAPLHSGYWVGSLHCLEGAYGTRKIGVKTMIEISLMARLSVMTKKRRTVSATAPSTFEDVSHERPK